MALKVTTFSSKGRVSRVSSHKSKEKVVHLQSDNQLRVFTLLEWDDNVKEIQINIELNNLEETLTDIDNLNLNRFKDKETGELFQLHTNFLVTFKPHKRGEEQLAISVKSTSELERKTAIEKLEIERRYWEAKGVRFVVITDKEIDRQVVDNLMWVRDARSDKSLRNKEELAETLYFLLQENKELTVNAVLNDFDIKEGTKEGTGLFLFRYLIAEKEIAVDMKKSINLSEKINKLVIF